jgi:hypothetical protein
MQHLHSTGIPRRDTVAMERVAHQVLLVLLQVAIITVVVEKENTRTTVASKVVAGVREAPKTVAIMEVQQVQQPPRVLLVLVIPREITIVGDHVVAVETRNSVVETKVTVVHQHLCHSRLQQHHQCDVA